MRSVDSAADVSDASDLSAAPARDVVPEHLVTNLACGPGRAEVSLISDDNFSPAQFTRVLNLAVTPS